MEIIVFTDGSSSRKKQKIGSGFVIYDKEIEIDNFSIGFYNCGRNGAAELIAMTFCLENLLKYKNEKIIIWCDPEYVTKSINEWIHQWVERDFYDVKNIEIILYMFWLKAQFKSIQVKWIKGHQIGDSFEVRGNRRADELAGLYKEESFDNLYNFDEFKEHLKVLIQEKDMRKFVINHYQYKRV